MPTYDVPGVYIEEVTGPGVIAGVGTSTAAFIGPALNGPLGVPQRISSFDEFLQQYAVQLPDGSYLPYIVSPRWFYLAHGVRSFFENGGAQAYIVRIGSAKNTTWEVDDGTGEAVFRLQAQKEGVGGNSITIAVSTVQGSTITLVHPTAPVASGGGTTQLTITPPNNFMAGDIITDGTSTAAITKIQGNVLYLSGALTGPNLRIADINPGANPVTFRVPPSSALYAGAVIQITGFDLTTNAAVTPYVVIQSIDAAGFVTLAGTPGLTDTLSMAGTAAQPIPTLASQEFRLVITQPNPPNPSISETWDKLSLNPLHPRYVFSAVQSKIVNVLPPLVPPTANTYPNALVNPPGGGNLTPTVTGAPDDPTTLTFADYSAALDTLRDIEDVNLLVIPDAATTDYQNIQNAMIDHCLLKGDRFAILDSRPGSPPTGNGSVEEQRGNVQADRGFAALYYPWLQIPDPTWKPSPANMTPATMLIPPSGAMAGVYARVDQAIGVHKAPANVDVQGVVGLERKLSDRQQGPLNLEGIDVLRIFPGSGQVTVWGARTTGDPNITDWIYVNVRRLMIYIEQSIEVGIRWAVFEPNNLALWQKLKRTLNEFLTRVWRDGALFGATADQAFYVRIDEALNPPSTRALGRLYIEIGVAPVRPAEFIIVRIGLWDGGTQVTES
jgi:phage tail sheath protein FI